MATGCHGRDQPMPARGTANWKREKVLLSEILCYNALSRASAIPCGALATRLNIRRPRVPGYRPNGAHGLPEALVWEHRRH
eukprot:328403-Rhodomonas_salina.3